MSLLCFDASIKCRFSLLSFYVLSYTVEPRQRISNIYIYLYVSDQSEPLTTEQSQEYTFAWERLTTYDDKP